MPVYNCEKYISQAIESIIRQTKIDVEVIIVNDGSTDQTERICRNYANIKIISQNNQGVANAINNGIFAASGKYIARLDADDISYPNRFEKQVNYLELNPNIDLIGSGATVIDTNNRKWGLQKMPETDAEIRWIGLFKSPFIHPSVMFRRKIIENKSVLYDPSCVPSEDYDFWIRILHTHSATNLNEPTIYYRIHSKGITGTNKRAMLEKSNMISINAFKKFLPQAEQSFSSSELNRIRALIISGTRDYASFGSDRTKLILDYISIWEMFRNSYSLPEKEAAVIRDQVIVKTCQMTFFPSVAQNSRDIISKLNYMDRKWPLIFFNSLPYAARALMRERMLRHA
jgi:glycosyltransferase involved in cell wall biosynthesis